jgi:hypothetical protein
MASKRPWLVVAFCVFCFVRGFMNMLLFAFSLGGKVTEDLPFFSIMTMILLGAMVGYWLMKRWGVYLLAAQTAVFLAVKWKTMHGVGDPALFLFALGLVTGLVYFRRMT